MNILDKTNEYVDKAIRNNVMGSEAVDHAVGLSLVPDASGQPTMVTTIVLSMSSVIIGQSHTMGFFVNTPIPTEKEIDQAIVKALGDLYKVREADLNISPRAPGADHVGRSLLT
jgi:hypothetical protein